MNGKKARAIRKKHKVPHVRLAKIHVVHDRDPRTTRAWKGDDITMHIPKEKPDGRGRRPT